MDTTLQRITSLAFSFMSHWCQNIYNDVMLVLGWTKPLGCLLNSLFWLKKTSNAFHIIVLLLGQSLNYPNKAALMGDSVSISWYPILPYPGFVGEYLGYLRSTHWCRDEMAAVWQTIFSKAFPEMKSVVFDHLNQRWIDILTHICITRHWWV